MSGALAVNLGPAKRTGGRVGSSIHRDHKTPEVKKKTRFSLMVSCCSGSVCGTPRPVYRSLRGEYHSAQPGLCLTPDDVCGC